MRVTHGTGYVVLISKCAKDARVQDHMIGRMREEEPSSCMTVADPETPCVNALDFPLYYRHLGLREDEEELGIVFDESILWLFLSSSHNRWTVEASRCRGLAFSPVWL